MKPFPITLGAVNVEASDPDGLAAFWAAALGSTPSGSGNNVYLPASPGGFAMFFQRENGPLPHRQKLHMDLTVPWGSRQREVERLLELGATFCWDVLDEHPHVQWTTMADPEGNLFCLAEHPPVD